MFGFAHLRIVEPLGSSRLPGLIVLDRFGQCFGIDAECERFEIDVPDVHRADEADILVEIVFRDLQYRFGFVVQFGAQMPARVVVAFVQVQDGMDMDFPFIRPLHQLRDQVG